AAEQRNELAPGDEHDELAALHHSITSSARPDRGSGTVMPTAFALFRLMYSSILYHLPNGLNRDLLYVKCCRWLRKCFPLLRCDLLAPSDSRETDGQMQQSRGAAAENCAAMEDTGGAAPTHPDGAVA